MGKSISRLVCLTAALTLVACSKGGGGSTGGGKDVEALNCNYDLTEADLNNLKIEGHGGARSGETVRYRLNQDACAPKAVSWQIYSSKAAPVESTRMMTTFKHDGEYVIAAKVKTPTGEEVEISTKTVVTSELLLTGPQLGMVEQNHHFELVIPAGLAVSGATWDFGDGSPAETGLGPKDHTYYDHGNKVVTVVVDVAGESKTLTHSVQVLPATDGMECVRDLVITGPDNLEVGQSGTFTAYIPPCLSWRTAQVRWNFGDGSLMLVGNSLTHSYSNPGTYSVRVDLFQANSRVPFLTITRSVNVVTEPTQTPTPSPEPGPMPTPNPEPSPLPNPNPQPTPQPEPGPAPQPEPGPAPIPDPTPIPDPSPAPQPEPGPAPQPEPGPSPIPDPVPVPDPTPEPSPSPEPAPAPEPGPAPVCRLGETRTSYSDNYNEPRECGVGGQRVNTYRTRILETCDLVGGEVLRWVETSRTPELVSEGQCMGQMCELPPQALEGVDLASGTFVLINGKWYLQHGASKIFYSSRAPAGTCSEVSERRTCDNGVIGGSLSHVYLSCMNGCPGVGSHGTVKEDVVVGQEVVPKQCQYGETGATDIYQTLATQRCESGSVQTSNTHRGGLITAGMCPTYSWTPTANYTACSADCGGQQNQIFECRDNKGEIAPLERCTGPAPVVTRLCDGNPDAVKRSESSSVIEEAGQSGTCPADQIGYTIKKREVTTTKNYACIDHSVQLADQTVSEGPWLEEKFCKDYAPQRCSKDPLTEGEARGRYEWMKKCQAEVPMLKEFLQQYDHTGGKLKDLTHKGNIIYASFMNSSYLPERRWIAPKSSRSSCAIPAGVYIAAICVVDCATPEQQVLGQRSYFGRLEYVHFEQAWHEQFKYVATMGTNSGLLTRSVQKTRVDQWTSGSEEDHDVLVFTMASGRQIKVTPGHAVLDADGVMKEAREFKVGDSLVQLGGTRDPIVSLVTEQFRGKVYNVYVRSSDAKHNVMILNGYLTGTAYYAGEGIEYLNRRILRAALTRGVFE